jgi:hypothetical protein
MGPAAKSLRYEVFPNLNGALQSAHLSNALRASTFRHLGYEIGLMYWREIQTEFCRRFMECEQPTDGDAPEAVHYSQRGHTENIGYRYYARADSLPNGVPVRILSQHLATSRCWQDLAGTSVCPDPLT